VYRPRVFGLPEKNITIGGARAISCDDNESATEAIFYDHPADPIALQLKNKLNTEGIDAVLKGICGIEPAGKLAILIKQKIDTFSPGGGYILASCNHIIDAKPQNVTAMFETAREYGRYS
jgi:hypothetical protein